MYLIPFVDSAGEGDVIYMREIFDGESALPKDSLQGWEPHFTYFILSSSSCVGMKMDLIPLES